MSFSESFKKIQRALGRYALMGTRAFVRLLPYPVFRFFSHLLIFIGRPILYKKRRLAMQNLQMAYKSEKTQKETQKIANDCFENFGRGMVDLIYFLDRPKEIYDRVRLVGKEHIDHALAQGKGVILVSAHFGNFILLYLRMVEAGYKTNVIMKRTRDAEFEKYITELRDQRGVKTIYDLPSRQCIHQCLKALRNNEILIILMDQNYGQDGRIFVDFFRQKAATASGPVVFSIRTGAPILPVFIYKDEGELGHKIVIDPPFVVEKGKDDADSLYLNVSSLTKMIETKIKGSPSEWGGWMHKRWKSRMA